MYFIYSTGFATQLLEECTDLVHIQVLEEMVTDMIMIVMKAAMEMMIRMVMEEKESMAMATGMMIVLAETETLIVVMEIGMAEIMKIAIAEMCTGTMTIAEEVEVSMRIKMAQAETLMMVNYHLGMNPLL